MFKFTRRRKKPILKFFRVNEGFHPIGLDRLFPASVLSFFLPSSFFNLFFFYTTIISYLLYNIYSDDINIIALVYIILQLVLKL